MRQVPSRFHSKGGIRSMVPEHRQAALDSAKTKPHSAPAHLKQAALCEAPCSQSRCLSLAARMDHLSNDNATTQRCKSCSPEPSEASEGRLPPESTSDSVGKSSPMATARESVSLKELHHGKLKGFHIYNPHIFKKEAKSKKQSLHQPHPFKIPSRRQLTWQRFCA